jgi:hypothetical protein
MTIVCTHDEHCVAARRRVPRVSVVRAYGALLMRRDDSPDVESGGFQRRDHVVDAAHAELKGEPYAPALLAVRDASKVAAHTLDHFANVAGRALWIVYGEHDAIDRLSAVEAFTEGECVGRLVHHPHDTHAI